MLEFLPDKFKLKLKEYNDNNLYEIRIRLNKKVKLIYNGKTISLNVTATENDIEEIVLNACKRSIYSYDNQIKQGFITTDNGERIGLSGEFVFNGNEVQSIRDFTSLCIRVPSDISGVSNGFFEKVYQGGSVLVISKTGDGKTTFIRDFCKNLSNRFNVVLIDERNEIAGKNQGFFFDVGDNTDVLTYSNKSYGFNQAIRTLNPNYIITDELMTQDDVNGVNFAISCGVNVIATIHGDNVTRLKNKNYIKELLNNKCFSYYILLKNQNGKRNACIYDEELKYICCI